MKPHVAVIIGSLRKAAWSRILANEIVRRARQLLDCRILEIADLPLYNGDLEAQTPAAWQQFRQQLEKVHAVLFVTPEYNRSIPGALKNAIDVGSRPEGQNRWAGKPAAVISQTPYLLGAFGANQALRQTFVFLDMPVMQRPEAYIGTVADKFSADGRLKDPETGRLLDGFLTGFAAWIARHSAAPGRDFRQFLERRAQVAAAYSNGDAAPLERVLAIRDPASFMSAGGAVVRGAEAVFARYRRDAERFATGSRTQLEIVHAESGALAMWSGIQHAQVRLKNGGAPVNMDLRITEVFRFEDGDWKLVHRHADGPQEHEASDYRSIRSPN
jgi:NAD(P)H-dependent FMN reductase/ketosteroid isomerase-like protein